MWYPSPNTRYARKRRTRTAEQPRLENSPAIYSFRVYHIASYAFVTPGGKWNFCTSRIFDDVTVFSRQTENGLGYSRTWCFWAMTARLHYPIRTHVRPSQRCEAKQEVPRIALNSESDTLATANQRSVVW